MLFDLVADYKSHNAAKHPTPEDKQERTDKKTLTIDQLEEEREELVAGLVITEEQQCRMDELEFKKTRAYDIWTYSDMGVSRGLKNAYYAYQFRIKEQEHRREEKKLRVRRIDLDVKILRSDISVLKADLEIVNSNRYNHRYNHIYFE